MPTAEEGTRRSVSRWNASGQLVERRWVVTGDDGIAVESYAEERDYDDAGNLLRTSWAWFRDTTQVEVTVDYAYDADGDLLTQAVNSRIAWRRDSEKPGEALPRIWIDGDGAPRAIKDIVFRAAEKRAIDVVLVANRPVIVPKHARISTVVVEKGLDVADAWLVANANAGDLVVTSDVPLAAELVAKGVTAMSARGETYTASNVREKLSLRDFFTEARESGITGGGGPPPLDQKVIREFANAFDRWLTAAQRR